MRYPSLLSPSTIPKCCGISWSAQFWTPKEVVHLTQILASRFQKDPDMEEAPGRKRCRGFRVASLKLITGNAKWSCPPLHNVAMLTGSTSLSKGKALCQTTLGHSYGVGLSTTTKLHNGCKDIVPQRTLSIMSRVKAVKALHTLRRFLSLDGAWRSSLIGTKSTTSDGMDHPRSQNKNPGISWGSRFLKTICYKNAAATHFQRTLIGVTGLAGLPAAPADRLGHSHATRIRSK